MSHSRAFLVFGLVLCLGFLVPTAGGDVTAGLVSHWKFDEGGGPSTADSLGSNHGILYGPEWTTMWAMTAV